MNLKDYIRGNRHGKDANQLERNAMGDPFLQDAIDGYDSVEGDHASVIEKLDERFVASKRRVDPWIWTVAAAVLLLLIGIPFLLHRADRGEDIRLASSEKVETGQKPEASLLLEDTLLVAAHIDLKKEADSPAKPEEPPVVQEEIAAEISEPVSPVEVSLAQKTELKTAVAQERETETLSNREADKVALEEVVVTDYGTQAKKSYTGSVPKKTENNLPSFGEKECKAYFNANCDKAICAEAPISATVEFYVGAEGRISGIKIKELSCPALETEIKRLLLGSPAWSERNRKVVMAIEVVK